MSQFCSGRQQPVQVPGAGPQLVLSRRALLRGFGTGAAALAAAPVLWSSTGAGAQAEARAGLPRAAAGLAGLHGATLSLAAFPSGTTWAQAIADWEGYTGTTIKASKVYNSPGVFPASISTEIQTFIGYLQALMAGRLQAGQPNADIAWFNGNGVNTISSSSDYRVPLWDSLVTATS
jgi:hypothetical protein